jgi:hypothetical protein
MDIEVGQQKKQKERAAARLLLQQEAWTHPDCRSGLSDGKFEPTVVIEAPTKQESWSRRLRVVI